MRAHRNSRAASPGSPRARACGAGRARECVRVHARTRARALYVSTVRILYTSTHAPYTYIIIHYIYMMCTHTALNVYIMGAEGANYIYIYI